MQSQPLFIIFFLSLQIAAIILYLSSDIENVVYIKN